MTHRFLYWILIAMDATELDGETTDYQTVGTWGLFVLARERRKSRA